MFTSTVYGYSIRLPAPDWTAVKATRPLYEDEYPMVGGDGVDTLVGPGGGEAGVGHPAIEVAAEHLFGWKLKDWTAKVIQGNRGSCRPLSSKRITVGGEPADLTELSCTNITGRHHPLWVTLLHGSLAFDIIWTPPPGTEAAARTEFTRALASLSFTS